MNDEAGSSLRLALQRSAQGFQALAHAAQTVAFGSVGAAPVVGNFQCADIVLTPQLHGASPRLRMAHDIGNGLAQGQSQHRLLRGRKRQLRQIGINRDARSLQRLARANQFGGQPFAAITADRFAYIRQRSPRSLFHIQHLLFGALRIAVHQLARQLGLQGDQRKSVSQQIVQVARDAFALGDFGQVLNLALCQLQLFLCAVRLRSEVIPRPTRMINNSIDPQKGNGAFVLYV